MHRNNNQNILRQKLEARNIQPSENTWNKLKTKLDEQSYTKRSKAKFYWAAASVIVSISVSALLIFNRGKAHEATPLTAKTLNTQHFEQDMSNAYFSTNKKLAEYETEKEKHFSKRKTVKNIAAISPTEINEAKEFFRAKEKTNRQSTSTENKNRVAVAPTDLTDAEVDILLDNAQKELEIKKRKNMITQAKATVLLDEVETDLQKNKSFKSKVYDEIEQKFNKIKTALSNK